MELSKNVEVARGTFDDIQIELTDLVFSSMFPTILIGTVGLTAATALMAYLYHDSLLWAMLALAIVVSGARIGIAAAYRGRDTSEPVTLDAAKRWELMYGVATIAYAALISTITLRVFSLHDPAGMFLCAIGSVTVCAGLASRIGLRPLLMKISGLVLMATLLGAALFFGYGQWMMMLGGVLAALYSITFVQSAGRNFDLVVDQLRSKRTLVQSSEQDALTQLPNRRRLRTRLSEVCKSGTPFAVLFLDLDNFKPVNDTFGHAGGDELLLQVTARLKGMMRESDLLTRIGGDEFAILQIPASTRREVVSLAERINQQIAAPYRIHGQKAVIGVSVGVRLALGGVTEPDTLLQKADTALYNVKAGGKGGFSVAVD